MADQKTLIRIMGESDIVDVTMTHKAASHALLMGLDAADKVNLLGHWMDQDRGAELAADQNHLDAMTIIASEIIASKATPDSALASQFKAGANFVLLTLLRENLTYLCNSGKFLKKASASAFAKASVFLIARP